MTFAGCNTLSTGVMPAEAGNRGALTPGSARVQVSPTRTEIRKGSGLQRRADHQGPEGLELGARVLHQGNAHLLGVGQQQVLVVPGARLPALDDLVERGLARADVLGGDLGIVAGALDAIPGIGAIGAEVRDAVPLGK